MHRTLEEEEDLMFKAAEAFMVDLLTKWADHEGRVQALERRVRLLESALLLNDPLRAAEMIERSRAAPEESEATPRAPRVEWG
jgi:hypothetical protein